MNIPNDCGGFSVKKLFRIRYIYDLNDALINEP